MLVASSSSFTITKLLSIILLIEEMFWENQRRFKTDADFVERIARQNHRVFPGDLVFIFDKD